MKILFVTIFMVIVHHGTTNSEIGTSHQKMRLFSDVFPASQKHEDAFKGVKIDIESLSENLLITKFG